MTTPTVDPEIDRVALAVVASHLEHKLGRAWVSEYVEAIETALDATDPDIAEAVRIRAHEYLAELRAFVMCQPRWIVGVVTGGAE